MTYRPHMPLSVKLEAAILQLGLDPKSVDFDHDPALGLRVFDETTKTYSPDANDPKFITIRSRADDHRVKTSGTPATTAGSDIHRIGKMKRLAKAKAALDSTMHAKVFGGDGQQQVASKREWPKGRKIPSRKFAEVRR
jgi:hypothetical protein